MSRLSWIRPLVLLILLPAAAFAQDQSAAPDSVRTALLRLEERWDDALVKKDRATLEGILAPGFMFIDADGSITRRAQLLEGVMAPELEIDPFVTRDVEVRLYDKTAVLTGWFEQTGRWRGQPYRQRARYTDVYVLGPAGWMAVSAHASTLVTPGG